jgi:hypothetical protein
VHDDTVGQLYPLIMLTEPLVHYIRLAVQMSQFNWKYLECAPHFSLTAICFQSKHFIVPFAYHCLLGYLNYTGVGEVAAVARGTYFPVKYYYLTSSLILLLWRLNSSLANARVRLSIRPTVLVRTVWYALGHYTVLCA